MQLKNPTKLKFVDNMKEEHEIKRIQASGFNSAAFNNENNFWLWGGTSRGKLGLLTTMRDQTYPIHV